MQRLWSADELGEDWTLGPEDLALLADLTSAGRLGVAAQLAYWPARPLRERGGEVVPAVVRHLAAQLGIETDALDGYDWASRTGRGHGAAASFDDAAKAGFRLWLADELLPRELVPSAMEAEVGAWFVRERVGRPGAWRLDRILRSARATHNGAALQRVADRLDADVRGRLDALLADDGDGTAFTRLAALLHGSAVWAH